MRSEGRPLAPLCGVGNRLGDRPAALRLLCSVAGSCASLLLGAQRLLHKMERAAIRAPRRPAHEPGHVSLQPACLFGNHQPLTCPPPASRVAIAADQRVSQGKGSGGEEEGDKGLVVVGASVVPLTLAQREELGAYRSAP